MAEATRKTFLAAATAVGAAIAVPAAAQTPSPSPKASPTPSPAARDLAQRMRGYDPSLTDEQLATIAQQIDDNNKFGAAIRKTWPLRTGDEPTPEFEVEA